MNDQQDILRLGDPWPRHYRGTRYHFNPDGHLWWRVPATEAKVRAASGHQQLVADLLKVRPEGGSCRITETGAVITKDEEVANDWEPLYVCEYVEPLEFAGVDNLSANLDPFDLWPSFYDGAKYSYKRGTLWWKNPVEGLWQQTNESLPPEIKKRLLRVKSAGSLVFTENGEVLTLIEPQPMPKHLKPQYEALSNTQKRLVQVKTDGTDMLPIYLGNYLGGFTLKPPERLTDPLKPEEEEEMVQFLKQYGDNIHGNEDGGLDSHSEEPGGFL